MGNKGRGAVLAEPFPGTVIQGVAHDGLHAAGLDKLRELLQSDVGTSADDYQDYDDGND